MKYPVPGRNTIATDSPLIAHAYGIGPLSLRALPTLNARNEEHLRTGGHRLEIAGLVQFAIDRDGCLFLERVTQARKHRLHRLDHPSEIGFFNLELPHTVGVFACEARGEGDRGRHDRVTCRPTSPPERAEATSAGGACVCEMPTRSRWRWQPSADKCSPRRRLSRRTDERGSAPRPGSFRSSADRRRPGNDNPGNRRYRAALWRYRYTPRSEPNRYLARRRPGSGLPRSWGGSPCRHPARRRSAEYHSARFPDRPPRRRNARRNLAPAHPR